MKQIKVNAWEELVSSEHVTDVKSVSFDLTEEILTCFPEYNSGTLSEGQVEELLIDSFWENREIKNLKITPFYNQTVRKKDVRIEFDVIASLELREAPESKFIIDFSVDRYCEGDYGTDRSHILNVLERSQEDYMNGSLVSETKEKLDKLVKRIQDILSHSEKINDFTELNKFKKSVYDNLRSWKYDVSSDDIWSIFSDLKIHDNADPRTLRKIEEIIVDFEVNVIEEWKNQISSYTDI